ncbi:putative PH domain-containing protein C19A8.02 [Colletotrichum chlorophyti]|uniref:Putative PH domain-containing protein C19A8.02 n=1 Tax=Colletotrichum chlorophyti TaxID=708187 RepID=A0A1Q8RB73_9PEZI|nr:putative PH domain-containing protein C19A8.02 [Colletotrichum chlorophyti]
MTTRADDGKENEEDDDDDDAAAAPEPSQPSTMGEPAVTTAPATAAATAASTPAVQKQPSPAIPVGLNEASLDSPTFRSTAQYFGEHIDNVEKWLDEYVKSTTRVTHDFLALEETVNTYLSKVFPPAATADAIIDHDYTLLALRRISDGSKEWWTQIMSTIRKMDSLSVEPIRSFIAADLRSFKEVRRVLDHTQKNFDQAMARYMSQSKTKEPSAIREEAFAVYETRKAYLKVSMDFCQLAPQIRFSLDKLLVRVSADFWKEMKRSRDASAASTKWGSEMDRIRGWSREMETSEFIFKRELQIARRDIGESTLQAFKPSRELDDYSASTVPFLGSRGPVNVQSGESSAVISEKQGWLFLKTLYGKPARSNWVRRWYYCRDGVFGWLINGSQGVLQGDEIGVLLCNAKPAVAEDRRFCFEVKTKSQTLVLQAETQNQLTEWLEVFEVAKKRAFEASMDRDSSSSPAGADPAFSITPPPLPEFSARSMDAIVAGEEPVASFDRAGTLPVPGPDGNLAGRASFDVNGVPRRSITALGRDLGREMVREEGESNREHAARIIQKLDLHRKATFGAGAEAAVAAAATPGSGGIAGMIASHGHLPGYPSPPQGTPRNSSTARLPTLDPVQGTLAPLTLARPPAATNLSRTAVMFSVDRSAGSDKATHMPTSVLANYWGSSAWSAVYGSGPGRPSTPGQLEENPFGIVVREVGKRGEEKPSATPVGHRKTVSVDAKFGQHHTQLKQPLETFPPGYPPELRIQHHQFRILFPTVPLDEKLVLVFRAAWSSSTGKDSPSNGQGLAGNGRIYITPDNMYFYGQQMGLVVAYAINLDIIAEVTAAPGKECDFIFLHLREDGNETGYTRITIKVFLDHLQLLHARLNLLIDDLQSEEPMELPELIRALISLEYEDYSKRSPSVESWEEVSSNTPFDNGTHSGRPARRQSQFGPKLRLHGSSSRQTPKLQLPAHPVVFEPEDMQRKVAERHFEISAKACFHVLFGDKSFVFPKLYFERRAQQIAQGPWTLADHGRMRREFQFKFDYKDMLGRPKTVDVVDHQTMEVFQDHVTYVVTHVKTAWHLPHSQYFKLVTKIVITHVAKSKCKLAIFTKVDWSKTPAFSKNLVERQALNDAEGDAEELADVATDQVRKLGAHSRTKRAIQVYGNIGQQTQVVVFSPADADAAKKQLIKPRTLTAMLLETLRSFGESAVTSLIMWAIAGVRKSFSVITAHRLILLLLAGSAFTNIFLTSKGSSNWWIERRAAKFMDRMGVGPNVMMSRAIYMADLGEATGAVGHNSSWPADSACFTAFQIVANATDLDTPYEDAGAMLSSATSRATARRLRRTRQRLGSYRHDLLVAMRIVNSIEREMVQSEWENWLSDENVRCDKLRTVLEEDGSAGVKAKRNGNDQKVMTSKMDGDKKEALREWYDTYCGSCKLDQQALVSERNSLSGL